MSCKRINYHNGHEQTVYFQIYFQLVWLLSFIDWQNLLVTFKCPFVKLVTYK